MSNETKREVLERLVGCYAEVYDAYTDETGSAYYCDDEPNYLEEYEAALPDDLPVIPEAVGEWLEWCKGRGYSLIVALDSQTRVDQDIFACAWVLGVWRVEETGEVVKL